MPLAVHDLGTAAFLGASVVPQTIGSATTTNGTGVDAQLSDGPIHAIIATGNAGDSTLTLDVKLQESDSSGSGYADITGAAITQLAGATAADNLVLSISTPKRSKRYVRAVVTTAGGGTISVPISVVIFGRKKISGSGTGYVS